MYVKLRKLSRLLGGISLALYLVSLLETGAGVNTERQNFWIITIFRGPAALCGSIVPAYLNSAQPKAGSGLELDVIAACFIGGAAVTGGVGKITGVVIGAFIMGVMNNGMGILGVGIDWQQVIKGAVLLLAVFLDVTSRTRGIARGYHCAVKTVSAETGETTSERSPKPSQAT